MEEVKLPFHDHPLHRSGGFSQWCRGCFQRVHCEDGYRCTECYKDFFLHKECAESPLEINLPSHHQHTLHLVDTWKFDRPNTKCYFCGNYMSKVGYHCSECDFWVDTCCATNPPPQVIEHPKAHEHTLTFMPKEIAFTCHVCGDTGHRYPYVCSQCDLFFHKDCVQLSPEINHPSHPRHPLKLLTDGPPDYTDGKCCLCGSLFQNGRLYHCSICNFSVDLHCAKCPPPLTFMSPKTHEHRLTLMPRHISFTCNACGTNGDRSPYVCLQCDFMIHRTCFDLPRLININRHDHRISHTYLLGPGISDWVCGVCHKKIDWPYGAYTCSLCPNFAAHSKCATGEVWDERELEGKPEEIEDIEPFKVIADNLINHFSHEEHNLCLNKDGIVCEQSILCKACIHPIYSDAFYSCTECDFVLHETCANLPRKKRHLLFAGRLTLLGGAKYVQESFSCYACERRSCGFSYQTGHYAVDVGCISISEPLNHESHPHPLYYFTGYYASEAEYCEACGEFGYLGFKCIEADCKFSLHYKCAVLPKTIKKHKSDDHPLFQCHGESNASGIYWCDICEKELDPRRWFYTCDQCSTTLHIECVLGDLFSGHTPGTVFTHQELKSDGNWGYIEDECWVHDLQVVANDRITRPYCCVCRSRCNVSLILKTHDDTGRYICSSSCLSRFHPARISS